MVYGVIAGLDPAIPIIELGISGIGMRGSSPRMTEEERN
jgi:hypothetical protein